MNYAATDTELLQRVRESDVEAFRLLFERYQPVVFRHVLFRTGHTELSHDIVQDTFMRVWERRALLRPNLSFLAFAFRISGNLVLDAVKHRKVREKLQMSVPQPAASAGDDPDQTYQLTALQEKIGTIVNQDLGERCRQIFLLSRFEGKTNAEIAATLHLSVRTVEHQISHALKVLRRYLKDWAS